MRLNSVVLLATLLASSPAAIGAQEMKCPAAVRIAFFDYSVPPYMIYEGRHGDTPSGTWVDWSRNAIAQSGCAPKVSYLALPIKRGYISLAQGDIDILAVSAYTPDRDTQFSYPKVDQHLDERLMYFRDEIHLYTLNETSSIKWVNGKLNGPHNFKVAVTAGTITELIARQNGWKVDTGRSGISTLEKLLHGRTPVMLGIAGSTRSLPPGTQSRLRKLDPPVSSFESFSPANKNFYAQYSAFVDRYWLELCRISRSDSFVRARAPACPGK